MDGPSSNPPSTRASPTLQAGDSKEGPTSVFRKEDFLFMEDFHRIVDLMLNGTNQEEIGIAVAKMDERFERARKVLQEIPGLQYVKEEQEAILQREMEVLKTKQKLLKLYMERPPFENSVETTASE
ncbi:hypothetical protein BX666DRAFT_1878662 [Dichotomocladium elegans]|nr:hypothetical protein BX666DRAFT_1878662 [Dichotomocladium elegans]